MTEVLKVGDSLTMERPDGSRKEYVVEKVTPAVPAGYTYTVVPKQKEPAHPVGQAGSVEMS